MHLEAGHILNNNCYQIKKVIGQGGFGITYLADEIGYFRSTGFGDAVYVKSKTPDQVVIKELFYGEYCKRDKKTGLISITNSEKKIEFEKLVQNQLNEGKKLRALNHPNIVRTRDIFKENDTAYMVMDFVNGTDLGTLLEQQSKLSIEKSFKYATQILSALSHIHERNQMHLDIKPSNVLIRKQTDEAVLIDFGASQSYDDAGGIEGRTSQLVVAMTKHYAPNEQGDIDNLKQFDATFDTYAVGATLYHMLSGEKPPLSSLLTSGREKLKPITSFPGYEKTSDFMDSIVSKALAPMYHARFKSAKEFEALLRKYSQYPLMLNEVQSKLLNGTALSEVLRYIEEAEKEFLPTESLRKLKNAVSEEHARELAHRDFDLNLQNDNSFFEQENNAEATMLLEKVHSDIESEDDGTILIDTSKTVPLPRSGKDKELTENKRVAIPFKQFLKENEKWVKYVVPTILVLIVAVALMTNYSKNNKAEQLAETPINVDFSTLMQDSLALKDKDIELTDIVPKALSPLEETRQLVEPSQIVNSSVESTNNLTQKSSEEVKEIIQTEKGEINLGGHTYNGDLRNGKPNGSGMLTFNFDTQVDENDPEGNIAGKGDYLKGRWNDGKLEFGTLYSSSGEKKVTIVIGRF